VPAAREEGAEVAADSAGTHDEDAHPRLRASRGTAWRLPKSTFGTCCSPSGTSKYFSGAKPSVPA
jgi:hypothetical protein